MKSHRIGRSTISDVYYSKKLKDYRYARRYRGLFLCCNAIPFTESAC